MSTPLLDQFGRPANYTSPAPSNQRFKSTEDDRYRLARPKLVDDMARLLGRERYKALISDARWIAEAFPLVQEAVQQKAEYVSAAGWLPEFVGGDRRWGERSTRVLHDALAISDVRGELFDWDDQWELVGRLWDIDGGSFQVFTQTESGFPQLQNIEAHRVGQRMSTPIVGPRDAYTWITDSPGATPRKVWGAYAGLRILNGIIYNSAGREVAYRVLGGSPDEDRDISARDMMHVCHPRWFSEGRPAPSIAYAVLDWYDVKETREFERLAQKVSSALTLVETNETGQAPAIPPLGNGPATPKTNSEPQEQVLFGGLIRYVKNGGNLRAHESSRPSDGWQKFDRTIVAGAFYGMGWRIEMMDLSLLGGAGVRGFQDNINMKIAARHKRLKAFALRAVRRTVGRLILRGDLPESPEWAAWDIPAPPEFTVDAGRAQQADRDNIRAGVDSTPDVIRRAFGTHYRSTLRKQAEYLAAKREIAAEFGLQPEELGTLSKPGDPVTASAAEPAAAPAAGNTSRDDEPAAAAAPAAKVDLNVQVAPQPQDVPARPRVATLHRGADGEVTHIDEEFAAPGGGHAVVRRRVYRDAEGNIDTLIQEAPE